MSGYNWTWPQIPSLTAMKYQRHGYVEVRPFELGKLDSLVNIALSTVIAGERMCGRRGLEKYVKGYRQIRNDLEKKREELVNNQNPVQYHLSENFIKVEFYKPVVASRYKFVS